MNSIKITYLVLILFFASSLEVIYSKSFSGYNVQNEQFIIIDIEFAGKDGSEVKGVIRNYEEINDAQKDYAANYIYAGGVELRKGFNEADSPFRGEAPYEEIKFSGKIISGDQNNGKIEVKLGGTAPWYELPNKSDRFWKIIPDQYGGRLEVPMVLSKSFNNSALTFLCLDRRQRQPATTSQDEKATSSNYKGSIFDEDSGMYFCTLVNNSNITIICYSNNKEIHQIGTPLYILQGIIGVPDKKNLVYPVPGDPNAGVVTFQVIYSDPALRIVVPESGYIWYKVNKKGKDRLEICQTESLQILDAK
jgi:hypothetical protein